MVRPWTSRASCGTSRCGIDVGVEHPPGRHVVDELDRAELDDAVAGVGVEPGGLGVEHDLTHGAASVLIRASNDRTPARAASRPSPVSMTKSARARFSASGSCRARMRSSSCRRHAGAGQHPRPLHLGRRGDDEDAVEAVLGAGLVEQRDIVEQHLGAGVARRRRRRGRRRPADGSAPRSRPGARGRRERFAQPLAVDAAGRHRRRHQIGERLGAAAARSVEPMHGGVGVPDRHAGRGEEAGGGGLAHADRAGEAEPIGPRGHASTAARSAASTSGRRPNQRSKPGTAWCSSMPRPSTATRPRRRASSDEGRGLGAIDEVGDQRPWRDAPKSSAQVGARRPCRARWC